MDLTSTLNFSHLLLTAPSGVLLPTYCPPVMDPEEYFPLNSHPIAWSFLTVCLGLVMAGEIDVLCFLNT